MTTKNPIVIGLVLIIAGIGILGFWGSALCKIAAYSLAETTVEAKIIGYKISSNGARMVKSNKTISGRSPFFEFKTNTNQTIKSYSKSPQIFMLFNYELNEEVAVAYPINNPQKAILISWKEIPGLILMIAFGLIIIIVGKSYLVKK
jgi:hypothetical protein